MRGAASLLRAREIRVDTAVSRQFSSLPGLMRHLKHRDKLRKTVIVHLGNNGYLERSDCDRATRIAARCATYSSWRRRNPRNWQVANNDILDAAPTLRQRVGDPLVRVLDGHPHWFADDRYHLSAEGEGDVGVHRHALQADPGSTNSATASLDSLTVGLPEQRRYLLESV